MALDYAHFLETVQQQAGLDRDEAEKAVRATLRTLAERLSWGEAEDVRRQLPAEVRRYFSDGVEPQAFGLDEFVHRVAEREGVEDETAKKHARAVFAALGRAITSDEVSDMAAQLPGDFAPLIQATRPVHPGALSTDHEGFVDRVAALGGLDREGARRATEAVLEALGERIARKELGDLRKLLPAELCAPLDRGDELSHGAARPLSAEGFIELVAAKEGVPPDQASAHTRAVLTTLREVIGDREWADVFAQLPDDLAALAGMP